ncbi:ACP S-malonyltransferase [Candidatus Parabeggiatoa sp. HSG14]|uniref:ACP S-malonyltransferase n=1 Tax=Candidatus Parabeggiatoa sp. HSG14 TaxID=3055593 RepID=UPI0025A6C891|nr:ACP S-malonyltransferase [Thiotrichales bacterium HSG14]
MIKHAYVFPGQGSQSVGMLADLSATYPIVKQTFEEASNILNYDLWKLTQEGPEEILTQTEKTQPALLAAGIAVWRIWQEQGGSKPILMAGHSFGEYSALVCAGALEFSDAVSLASDRGRFMQAVVAEGEGTMAAVLGLEDAKIIEICTDVNQGRVVSPANFNAPGQVVIAGHVDAVKWAMKQAKAAGAKRTTLLQVSVPAHSTLMRPAAEKMAERLANVTITTPTIPVIHNVDVSIKNEPADIRAALTAQIYSPVRWVETIEKMVADGVTMFFESGPGKVLTGLNKRITRKKMKTLPIVDTLTLEQALKALEVSG